jgi:hypothetical protein
MGIDDRELELAMRVCKAVIVAMLEGIGPVSLLPSNLSSMRLLSSPKVGGMSPVR